MLSSCPRCPATWNCDVKFFSCISTILLSHEEYFLPRRSVGCLTSRRILKIWEVESNYIMQKLCFHAGSDFWFPYFSITPRHKKWGIFFSAKQKATVWHLASQKLQEITGILTCRWLEKDQLGQRQIMMWRGYHLQCNFCGEAIRLIFSITQLFISMWSYQLCCMWNMECGAVPVSIFRALWCLTSQ